MRQVGSWRWGRMVINGTALTHTGNRRETNQDFFCMNGNSLSEVHDRVLCNCENPPYLLAGIFDGFGSVGASAAHATTALLTQMKISNDSIFSKQMERYISEANAAVRTVCKEKTRSGGTTATISWISRYSIQVCNLGDSPGYLFHGGKLIPLYVADNEISYGAVLLNSLTQYLGMDTAQQQLQPHFASAKLSRRDRLLFCSDGLTAELSLTELESVLDMRESPENTVELLLYQALAHGGKDNITIMVIDIF